MCSVGGKKDFILPSQWSREERKDSQCWTLWGYCSVYQVSVACTLEGFVSHKLIIGSFDAVRLVKGRISINILKKSRNSFYFMFSSVCVWSQFISLFCLCFDKHVLKPLALLIFPGPSVPQSQQSPFTHRRTGNSSMNQRRISGWSWCVSFSSVELIKNLTEKLTVCVRNVLNMLRILLSGI